LEAAGRTQKLREPGAQIAQRRGILIHMLLQYLPDIEPDRRQIIADTLLNLKAPDIDLNERLVMRDQVLRLLGKPEMQMLLGSDSRAEVEISGSIQSGSGAFNRVMARIDRLAVLDNEVLIADFKTGKPPADLGAIPDAILRQLALYSELLRGIYPAKKMRAGIIWTSSAELVFADEAELNKALCSI
jgi:ATP-dependent helicase/nuclease subunit A